MSLQRRHPAVPRPAEFAEIVHRRNGDVRVGAVWAPVPSKRARMNSPAYRPTTAITALWLSMQEYSGDASAIMVDGYPVRP